MGGLAHYTLRMQPPMPFGEVIAVVTERLGEARGLPWIDWTWAPGETTFSATRHGQLPHSASGWLLTCISFVTVFALGAGLAYAARRLLTKRSAELDVLMNQSAAFYSRWPEQQLSAAPRSEMMAEADRSQRIVDLLQRRAVTSKADSRYLQGPIAGVKAWITLLHKTMGVPLNA